MRSLKKYFFLSLLALTVAIAAGGCRKKNVQEATEAESSAAVSKTARETAAAASGYVDANGSILPLTIKYETGTAASGGSTVKYPVLDDVSDEVNALIKKNAESILSTYNPGADDVLKLDCEVIALDKSRATVIWQGTFTRAGADPVNLFLSNTIDLAKAGNITLNDLVDAATVADYVFSDDCYFTNLAGNLSAEAKESLLSARSSLTPGKVNDLLKNADFPLDLDSSTWYPGSFSFEKDGVIYFTIPVTHELGDYALITYTPETK